MKKVYFLASIVAFLFVSIGAQAQTNVDDVLKFKNDQYDFGKISFGKPVSYVIEVTNVGKDTVTLLNARPGCGCTTPNFKPNQKMGPGQKAQVQITFNGSAMGIFSRFTDIEFSGGLRKQTKFSGEGVAITETAPANSLPTPVKQ
jgi:hypothetical protein